VGDSGEQAGRVIGAREVITRMISEVDVYTQERARLPQRYRALEADDLWLAERHFCVASWIWELHQRGAAVWVREHQQIPGQPLDSMPPVATTAHGRRSDQRVTLPALPACSAWR
jgi:hypothetical protein